VRTHQSQPDGAPAGQIRRATLWTLAFLLLLALALPAIGVRDMATQLALLDPALLLAVLGLSLANYALRSLRWQVLTHAVGLRVPLYRNSLYYVAGFAFAITPGKIGEAIRLWLLRRHHDAAYARTLGLLAIDRVTDALPLLALCLPGLAGLATGQSWSVAAVAAAVLGGSALVLRPGWLAGLVRLVYGRVRRRPRLFAGILRMLRSLRTLAEPRVLAVSLGLGLLGWSAEVLGAWLVIERLSGAEIGLMAAAFIFSFSMLVGGLPLFPGGVGGVEGTMIALLFLLGVDIDAAVAATAVIRLATLGFALLLGFTALPFAIRRSAGSHPATVSLPGYGRP
jgi:glycosyltransferase 2 family protein